MSNNIQNNDKHIHGDVQATNVTEATTPLDDASCCASDFQARKDAVCRELVEHLRNIPRQQPVGEEIQTVWTPFVEKFKEIGKRFDESFRGISQ